MEKGKHPVKAKKIQAEDRPGYDLWAAILAEMATVRDDGGRYYETGNKTAARRARVALDRLSHLKVAWRKELKA